MCGIAGFIDRNGSPQQALLAAMAGRLRHRGPDDSGLHICGNTALAHTRLSIIDLAGGHQPLFADEGKLALIANGEIYNHVELRAELEQHGHRFSTRSDCETILHAYRHYGDGFIDRLYGMFAFALYDSTRDRLILARDRLGIKPLYVADTGRHFAFASEIKALLPLPGLSREPDPAALLQYLQNQFISGSATAFRDVRQLPPGEIWIVQGGGMPSTRRYWSIADIEPRAPDMRTALREFDDLMETVMRQHMRTDVPFGLFLSGGVDSSLLLALLARYRDEPVRSFAVGFPGSGIRDELPVAAQLAQRYATRHTLLEPSGDSLYRRLVHTVWAADSLMLDYASLPTALLGERSGHELKVVFSGEGGDEVFAGYGRYRMHPLLRALRSLVRPGSAGFRTRGVYRSGWPQRLFGDDLLAAGNSWRDPVVTAWRSTPQHWSTLARLQAIDLVTALPDNLLVKLDRMLMAYGVEGRVPLVDHRVVEFGLGLPDALKVSGHQGKHFLKQWLEREIPDIDFRRRKRGFAVPVGDWVDGPLLDRLESLLPAQEVIRRWFRPRGIRQLIDCQRRRGGRVRPLWTLLQLSIWHRLFVETDGAAPPGDVDPLDFIA